MPKTVPLSKNKRTSRRESLSLHNAAIASTVDKNKIAKIQSKRGRKRISSMPQSSQEKAAARFKLFASGARNLSTVSNLRFTPSFSMQHPISDIRPLRAARITSSEDQAIAKFSHLFHRMLPPHLWKSLFIDLNDNILERRHQSKLKNQNYRQYRTINESTFWKFVFTLVGLNLDSGKTIADLYRGPLGQEGLLSENHFSRLRPLFFSRNLDEFADQCSEVWTSALIPSGVMCFDESLWKFIQKIHKYGDDPDKLSERVVRHIERKPAEWGVLAYELCSFLSSCGLPYTSVVLPMTATRNLSASEACLLAIDSFLKNKPKGTGDLVFIGDGAFSSSACLKQILARGMKICVSLNKQWHSELCSVLEDGLQQFEYRCFSVPNFSSETLLFTAYKTEYKANGSSKLLILNASNAYVPKDELSSTEMTFEDFLSTQWKETTPSPEALAVWSLTKSFPTPHLHFLNLTVNELMKQGLSLSRAFSAINKAATIAASSIVSDDVETASPSNDMNGFQVRQGRPPKAKGRGRPPKKATLQPPSASSGETELSPSSGIEFIGSSDYPSITLSGKQYDKAKVLSMGKKKLEKLLQAQGFTNLSSHSKSDLQKLLWSIKTDDYLKECAGTFIPKSSKLRSQSLEEVLPQLYLYRQHFAAVDRLDIYLSNSESRCRQKYWRTRFMERILMIGLNNIRAIMCDEFKQIHQRESPHKPALSFLQLVFRFFDQRSKSGTSFLSS